MSTREQNDDWRGDENAWRREPPDPRRDQAGRDPARPAEHGGEHHGGAEHGYGQGGYTAYGQMAQGGSDLPGGGFGGANAGGFGQQTQNSQWGQGGMGPMTQGANYSQGGSRFGPAGYESWTDRPSFGAHSDDRRPSDPGRPSDQGRPSDPGRHDPRDSYGQGRRERPEEPRAGPAEGLGGRGGGTYGQEDYAPAARRSTYQTDQHDDRRAHAEDRGFDSTPESNGHEHHYRRWRDTQLAAHDRDYGHWRNEQARRYDEDYSRWRNERHSAFSTEFEGWRASRGGQSSGSVAGVNNTGGAGSVTGPDGGTVATNAASERSVYGDTPNYGGANTVGVDFAGGVGSDPVVAPRGADTTAAHGANPSLADIADGGVGDSHEERRERDQDKDRDADAAKR